MNSRNIKNSMIDKNINLKLKIHIHLDKNPIFLTKSTRKKKTANTQEEPCPTYKFSEKKFNKIMNKKPNFNGKTLTSIPPSTAMKASTTPPLVHQA